MQKRLSTASSNGTSYCHWYGHDKPHPAAQSLHAKILSKPPQTLMNQHPGGQPGRTQGSDQEAPRGVMSRHEISESNVTVAVCVRAPSDTSRTTSCPRFRATSTCVPTSATACASYLTSRLQHNGEDTVVLWEMQQLITDMCQKAL